MTSIGPGSETRFVVTRAISQALTEHTKYVSNLSLWKRFLIWRYTLGSGALNTTLIGIEKDDQVIFWTYKLFKSYNYGKRLIDKDFESVKKFFGADNAILYLRTPNRAEIGREVVEEVIRQIEDIILKAPGTREDFYVYKVSTKYPGLEEAEEEKISIVHQKPFNSTTYNPQFNFAPFIAPEATCCLHRINIKRGSRVLMIP